MAREAILDAAERRLAATGVAGLRLQEIADDVGVSHPAVLHHFGSREGLVEAVVHRAIGNLHEALARTVIEAAQTPLDGAAMFEKVHRTLAAGGHARLVASLVLAGVDPLGSDELKKGWRRIVDSLHALRTEGPGPKPTYEDTAFAVLASAFVLVGDALLGPSMRRLAGIEGAEGGRRLRAWAAQLFADHLMYGPRTPAPASSKPKRRR